MALIHTLRLSANDRIFITLHSSELFIHNSKVELWCVHVVSPVRRQTELLSIECCTESRNYGKERMEYPLRVNYSQTSPKLKDLKHRQTEPQKETTQVSSDR